jgi:ribosomal protein S18 acetylase RimI-like enzyme
VRALRDDERGWLRAVLVERWGGEVLVGRGRVRHVDELLALVAVEGDERVGVLTYVVEGEAAEIVTLDALREGAGAGRALLDAVAEAASRAGVRRLLVMTTNDNLRALRLYQRAGFRLRQLRPGAVEQARCRKPSIPVTGHDGIPIRDELDLVRELG